MRETVGYKRTDCTIPESRLTTGQLIRCSFVSQDSSGILVSTPFAGFTSSMRIFKERIMDDEDELANVDFQPNQPLVAKVLNVGNCLKTTLLSSMMSDVYNYDYEVGYYYIQNKVFSS